MGILNNIMSRLMRVQEQLNALESNTRHWGHSQILMKEGLLSQKSHYMSQWRNLGIDRAIIYIELEDGKFFLMSGVTLQETRDLLKSRYPKLKVKCTKEIIAGSIYKGSLII